MNLHPFTLAFCLVALITIWPSPSHAARYENSCICGHRYENNCAHFLTNWMIENRLMTARPSESTANCASGRPIRAKDVRKFFRNQFGAPVRQQPRSNSYIYVERRSDGQGHVYYGTKSTCVAGTGNGNFAGSDAIWEFYR